MYIVAFTCVLLLAPQQWPPSRSTSDEGVPKIESILGRGAEAVPLALTRRARRAGWWLGWSASLVLLAWSCYFGEWLVRKRK